MFQSPQMEFLSRRSPVISRRAMVAASQPLAVMAGLDILRKGGNAADAAVATSAALNVTEPTSTGIGGDCFALYYDSQSKQVSALNGSGRAPKTLTLERLQQEGYQQGLPVYHPYTITTPGACAGWCDMVERFGRLTMRDVLAPAIQLAEAGFPVAPVTALFWEYGLEKQLRHATGGLELTIDGRAPRAGEIFRNPGLARTFRQVADGGKRVFYEGEIAQAIVSTVKAAGGCLQMDDLAAHTSSWVQPIHVDYRGLRVWECPPNGQGLAALLALNILEGFDLSAFAPLSTRRLHLEIEAMRLAFADAAWYVADPAFSPMPLEWLLSKDYASQRRHLINLRKANLAQTHSTPPAGTDTVYFCVVDGDGNACSFINSNYTGFGTGIIPKGWGFTLQNRGNQFSLKKGHPNALAPGKRPYHTIIPGMITQPLTGESRGGLAGEQLFAAFGVMGGFMQPQGHVQVVSAIADDRLDPQAALDRLRFCILDGEAAGKVSLEDGIPSPTVRALHRMGHPVEVVSGHERAIFGRGQIIYRDPANGVLWGGSDPRADGCVMGE
jgi:gamma-glutamyltranspeptidase/glutathione hydrolase